MTQPIARVLALLEILQSGGTRTVADLAARLDVDERTVRRYARHLIDLDIPVEAVRGRYGGYHLAPGYRMPPLMLTNDEALATLLGLIVGHRAGLVTTSTAAAESAAAKLRRVLPDALSRRLDGLLRTAQFTLAPRTAIPADADMLLLLAEAARQQRPVEISYRSADGRQSVRTVHPYGIVAHSGRWYLTGADSAHGQHRTFRVDRIAETRLLPGAFLVPPGVDAVEQVLSGLAQAPHQFQVVLRVNGTAAQVRSRLPPGLATVSELAGADGWVRVQLQAEHLDWVPAVLAGLDLPFRLEGPDELRELVLRLADRLRLAAGFDHQRDGGTP